MSDKKKEKRKRRIRLRTIFLLAITLASNSFAWFIYSTKVSNNITAKVRSWHVNFEVGAGEMAEEYIEIKNIIIHTDIRKFIYLHKLNK